MEAQSNSDESPINHYRLLADVRDTVDHDAIVTEDGARLKLPVTQLCPLLRLLSVRASQLFVLKWLSSSHLSDASFAGGR